MKQDLRKYIWLEFVIWFLILCICVTGVRIYRHKAVKKLLTYQIFMPDVDGLIVGSPVKFLGVPVGYISKVKIVSNEVYLKFVITDEDFVLPKGAIATVEFNGMGGSKSLEIYPPTKESIASGKIIAVNNPVRLNDAMSLLGVMYNKIDSIIQRASVFANETGALSDKDGVNVDAIEENMNEADRLMKKYNRGAENGKRKSNK